MCLMQCSVCSLKCIVAGACAGAGEVCIGGWGGGGGANEGLGSDHVT